MGTRGAVGFRYQDTDKVSYNHFDSYPSGLGASVVGVIRRHNDEHLAGAANRLVLVDEMDPVPPELIERYAPQFSQTHVGGAKVNQGTVEAWYNLLREAQGDLEPFVDGRIDHMIDGHAFLWDSLFCEWAYILNMDTRELEVYSGFNDKGGTAGRYASPPEDIGEVYKGYAGVTLFTTIPLAELRDMADAQVNVWLSALEKLAYPDDDDGDDE